MKPWKKIGQVLLGSALIFGAFFWTDTALAADAGSCECRVELVGPDPSACTFPNLDDSGNPTAEPVMVFKINDLMNLRYLANIPVITAGCPTLFVPAKFYDDKIDPPVKISSNKCKSKTIAGSGGQPGAEFIYQLNDCKYTAPPKPTSSGGGGAAGTAETAPVAPVAGAESPVGVVKKYEDVFDSGNPDCNKVCQWITENYKRDDYKGPIPQCAFTGQCRDVNDLVQFFILQGKGILGLIGVLALGAFVYGGILMVFSFGSPDKVTQGKDVMIAAVVGIIIVFSAYIGVNFLLNTVGVNKDLQAIK